MPTFQYTAKTRAGELVSGSLAAGDRRAALAELGKMGFFPLAVDPPKRSRGGGKSVRSFRDRVKSRDVLMFTQQLSSLLRSGMSLSQALGTLERRSQKKSAARRPQRVAQRHRAGREPVRFTGEASARFFPVSS